MKPFVGGWPSCLPRWEGIECVGSLELSGLARLVFGMNVSLDGYVDHDRMSTSAELFGHWLARLRQVSGVVYGRGMYEVMRYWEVDQPGWDEARRAYAVAWRAVPKWVVSRTLTSRSVGGRAELVSGDVEQFLRNLPAGEFDILGPQLAHAAGAWGLVDEYRLYVQPVVLGEWEAGLCGGSSASAAGGVGVVGARRGAVALCPCGAVRADAAGAASASGVRTGFIGVDAGRDRGWPRSLVGVLRWRRGSR